MVNILKTIFSMYSTHNDKNVHIGITIVLLRIVRLDNIKAFEDVYEYAYSNIMTILHNDACKVKYSVLECMLYLNRMFIGPSLKHIPDIISILKKYISSAGGGGNEKNGSKLKKVALDNIYLLLILHNDGMKKYIGEIYDDVISCKNHKDGSVRESAINCIDTIRSILHTHNVDNTAEDDKLKYRNNSKKGREKRIPIKSMKISPSFQNSHKEGVEIFVPYPTNDDGEYMPEHNEDDTPVQDDQKFTLGTSNPNEYYNNDDIVEDNDDVIDHNDRMVDEDNDIDVYEPIGNDRYDYGELRRPSKENINNRNSNRHENSMKTIEENTTSRLTSQRDDIIYKPAPRNNKSTSRDERDDLIDYQYNKIGDLTKQISALTNSMNIIMNKTNSIENNMIHMSMNQHPGMPYMVPTYLPYPAYTHIPTMSPTPSFNSNSNIHTLIDEYKREIDEKNREISMCRRKISQQQREQAPKEHLMNRRKTIEAEVSPHSRDNEGIANKRRQRQEKEHDTRTYDHTVNIQLYNILKDKEYRRLLNFLSNRDNMKNIHSIDSINISNMVRMIVDVLKYKQEMYIEASIPWVILLINNTTHISVDSAYDMIDTIHMIINSDRKRKTYKNNTVKQLSDLIVSLQYYIDNM